ncbi:glycerophosphodiester phosphodiesterase family protein [Frigoribacterium sp. MCBA15_019]|uniref:glycerophosphodiester phosphodiesterase family protein n=1 Tax=Frigoribacterium sp. MCBA15_019 TaxID=1898745 RepID=UPI0008DD4093|nr:glycerophosphodiester phosphodiesterase family protein [Frigoribacterium sp. MCBA15_019]OII23750.1 glycerophosphodiester phosphodiesterase [Frigoribacterium sp. MCBA15_019]
MSTSPLVIAHRGASGHRPEHGEDAYRLAIELGADAIEPDLVASSDGVLVLRHENEISGTTDVAEHDEFRHRRTTKTIDGTKVTGWFTEDFTWDELSTLRIRERLPELRPESAAHDGEGRIQRLGDLLDLLDAADRPVGLVAEVKHATYFDSIGLPLGELLADELRQRRWVDDPRLTIESFEQTVLGRLADQRLGARLVYLLEKAGVAADLVALGRSSVGYRDQLHAESLESFADAGLHGVSLDKHTLVDARGVTDGRVVDRAHAAGLDVFTWTLRAENAFLAKANRGPGGKAAFGDWHAEFTSLMALGVDGVFADQPELAEEARVAFASR